MFADAFESVLLFVAFELGEAAHGLTGPLAGLEAADVLLFLFPEVLLLFVRAMLRETALSADLAEGLVIAGVIDEAALLDFDDAFDDVIEEVAIVGDEEDRALEIFEEPFEPEAAIDIQVVGGFVQEEDVGLFEEELGEGEAALLPAAEAANGDVELGIGEAEAVKGCIDLVVDGVATGGFHVALDAFLELHELVEFIALSRGHFLVDFIEVAVEGVEAFEGGFGSAAEGFAGVEDGVLVEVADAAAALEEDFAGVLFLDTCEDLEQGGFALAVAADDAELIAGFDGDGDTVEDGAGAEGESEVVGCEGGHGECPMVVAKMAVLAEFGAGLVAKAGGFVVVDHAAGLHEGVADGAADELEAEFGEELAHAVGEGCARGDGADVGDVVVDGGVIDDGPEGVREGGAAVEEGEVGAGVGDGGVDLEAIADDAGVDEELFDFGRGVAGHARGIEVVEGLAV